ncbi:hypothetical protein IQ283_18310 [Alkalihalobacillus hwajinpoensis]|uniref:hypothetical protein n=1 Tax=Guptibacillus hwajinpoensis TaxID=208199 RepID=UPI001883C2AB|nr:hypothetical protein [Pseudalkalibacillus hwajinpoensis]MBF0708561.1 hypothetical protein [Pseudalkalibacillus hwajinpoensis]
MAFGLSKRELAEWKAAVSNGEVALLTHFWYDPRFPQFHSVTKAGCRNKEKLARWGEQYGLKREWMHDREEFPHFDLLGDDQIRILEAEGLAAHIHRFRLTKK